MRTRHLLYTVLTLGIAGPAAATTKGLNQIVTPDIQPVGILSLSYQQVDPNIANRYQVQLELGVTPRLEFAAFEGFSPQETIFNGEYGLVQSKHALLSAGFANWSSMGSSPEPYLEAGYLNGATYLMAGTIYIGRQNSGVGGSVVDLHQTEAILGAAYRVVPRLLLQIDYQGGSGNFSSYGFTYTITPQLQFNPAVYVANAPGHASYGYAVLTWNIDAFRGLRDFHLGVSHSRSNNNPPTQGSGTKNG